MTVVITALFFWKARKNKRENLVVDLEVPSLPKSEKIN